MSVSAKNFRNLGIELIHRALTNLRDNTKCACRPEDYPIGSCNANLKGYAVSVAVLRKVRTMPYDPE